MKALLPETKRRVVICETFCGILRFLSFLEFLIGLLTKEISSYLNFAIKLWIQGFPVGCVQSVGDIFELIKVILILMAYKPDGTRQTEALFIISRTIIAFNPLGSVSSFWYSLGHQRTSRPGLIRDLSWGLWWDWKVNALCYAIIKFKSGEFSNWCRELGIWLAYQSVSISNLLSVERIKNIISFKRIKKEKMKFLNITENKQATWTHENFLELIIMFYFILIVFVFEWQYRPGRRTGHCPDSIKMDRF